ncbi:hypothetical protein L291_4372 [Acinetobacter guillouiae MSP4-18]|nr:hypothetical protein L291_4372 [Acinetobacter guillouiae MSP4-18]
MKKLVIILSYTNLLFSACYASNISQQTLNKTTKVLEKIGLNAFIWFALPH